RRFRFRAEAQHFVFAGELAGEDHLDCYDSVEADLARPVNHTHPASGDLFQEFVVAKALTSSRWRLISRLDGKIEQALRTTTTRRGRGQFSAANAADLFCLRHSQKPARVTAGKF